jgi:integrase
MGTLFRKTYTKPVPVGAEIVTIKGKVCARWRARGGKTAVEEVATLDDGRQVVRTHSSTYYATYRNGDGRIVTVPTGCKGRGTAEQFLRELERDAERIRAGVVTHAELHRAERMAEPIDRHIDAYLATLAGSKMHRQNTGSYLCKLVGDCGWSCLADMRRADLETWLAAESRIVEGKPKRSARSRNAHQTAVVSFCNWCVDSAKVMPENPFARMAKASLDADPRRTRRALTIEEFQRLLEAARTAPERPAAKSVPKPGAMPRRPEVKLSGPERAELYIILVGTGLRVGELAKLKVRDILLDTKVPGIDLPARVGKNKKRNVFLPLRRDLVELLRPRVECRRPTDPVFDVPSSLIARFDADCKRAGVAKRDDRDLTVDIHSLRKTFNTWLAAAGVAPRIAQELMRHEDIDLTMGVYTDPKIFDLSAAVEALPLGMQLSMQCASAHPGTIESTDVHSADDRSEGRAAS